MKITLNAQPHDTQATTLGAALIELGYNSPAIATALNGAFVSRSARDATVLSDGDRIEVLAPMQGG